MKRTLYMLIAVLMMASCTSAPKNFKFQKLAYADTTGYCTVSLSVELPKGHSKAERIIRDTLIAYLDGETRFFDIESDSPAFEAYLGKTSKLDKCVSYYAGNFFRTIEEMAEMDGTHYPWDYDIVIERIGNSDKYIVFDCYSYIYLGGAHGGVSNAGPMTFRLSDGKKIEKFIDDSALMYMQEPFRKGLIEYLKECGEDVTEENLFDMTFIDDGVIPFPINQPAPSKDGLVFTFQQYEIAPYAIGMPSFTVPYEELAPYLTEEARSILE